MEIKQKISSFTDLTSWQEAHRLVLMIYKETAKFPKEEMFGLVSQMRRASVSITSNIAEGFSRQYYSEKAQFYCMAQGSNTELQNQLMVARDVGFMEQAKYQIIFNQSVVTYRLLGGLIGKTKKINAAHS